MTREEQDAKIQLPKGYIFKLAEAAKTKVVRILTPCLNFDDRAKMPLVYNGIQRSITVTKFFCIVRAGDIAL